MTSPPHSPCHGVPDTERYKEEEEENGKEEEGERLCMCVSVNLCG